MAVSQQRCAELVSGFGTMIRNGKYIGRQIDESVGLPGFSTPVLSVLEHGGEQRLGSLACGLHLDPSVISRHVAELEKFGFISRRPDPADGRAALLQLTDAGRAALAASRNARTELLQTMFTDWTDEDLALLVSMVDQMNTSTDAALVDDAIRSTSSKPATPSRSQGPAPVAPPAGPRTTATDHPAAPSRSVSARKARA